MLTSTCRDGQEVTVRPKGTHLYPAQRVAQETFAEAVNRRLSNKNLAIGAVIGGASIVVGAPVLIFGGTFILTVFHVPILIGLALTTIPAIILTPLPLVTVIALALYGHRKPIQQFAAAPMTQGFGDAAGIAAANIRKAAGSQNAKNLGILVENFRDNKHTITGQELRQAFDFAEKLKTSTETKRKYADPALKEEALTYYRETVAPLVARFETIDLENINRPDSNDRSALLTTLSTFHTKAKKVKEQHQMRAEHSDDVSTVQNLEAGVQLAKENILMTRADVRRIKDLIHSQYENAKNNYSMHEGFSLLKTLYKENFAHAKGRKPKFSKTDMALLHAQTTKRADFAQAVAQFHELYQALAKNAASNAPADVEDASQLKEAEKQRKKDDKEVKKRDTAETKAIAKAQAALDAAESAVKANGKGTKKAKQAIKAAEQAIKKARTLDGNVELAEINLANARSKLGEANVAKAAAKKSKKSKKPQTVNGVPVVVMADQADELRVLQTEVATLNEHLLKVQGQDKLSKDNKIAFNEQARDVYLAAVALAKVDSAYQNQLEAIKAVHTKYFGSGATEKLGRHVTMNAETKDGQANRTTYAAQLEELLAAAQAMLDATPEV